MTADALSQEEIDALLKGASEGEEKDSVPGAGGGTALSPEQTDALKRYADLMAATQGEMIGTFLAQSVESRPQEPVLASLESPPEKISGEIVLCSYTYSGALQGASALVFKQEDATRIGGTMVGDASASEFGEMIADAFREVLNTILGNLNTSLSGTAGSAVSVESLQVRAVQAGPESLSEAVEGSRDFAVIPYELSVGDDLTTECWQLFPPPTVESIRSCFAKPEEKEAQPQPAPSTPQAAPVEFEDLAEEPRKSAPPNLELIMDIGLEVRVELGRTHMRIRDVLNLGGGSVVELDKLAGEPVDLLINDVIFAKGEVVVIDENFGVRITDILSLNDRIKTLGERSET